MNSEVWGHANGRRTAGIIDGKLVFLCHASPHAPVFEIYISLSRRAKLSDGGTRTKREYECSHCGARQAVQTASECISPRLRKTISDGNLAPSATGYESYLGFDDLGGVLVCIYNGNDHDGISLLNHSPGGRRSVLAAERTA